MRQNAVYIPSATVCVCEGMTGHDAFCTYNTHLSLEIQLPHKEIYLFLFQNVAELYVCDLIYLLNFKTLIIDFKFVFRYTGTSVTYEVQMYHILGF